ncbi:MAG: ATP-binding protein [Dehalococcoidia bacterium]
MLPHRIRGQLLSALTGDEGDPIALVDPRGALLHANAPFEEMQGLPPGGVGRHLRDLSPDAWVRLGPVIERAVSGQTVAYERGTLGHSRPPVERHWEERWRPVREGDGRVVAILGTARDVTRWHEQLDEQTHLAESRARLIETASHELRGPLASVLGFAHRLHRGGPLSPEAAEAAHLIREQAEEMAFRLDLFLGLAELDRPRSSPSEPPEEIAIDELLEREAAALRARRPGAIVDVHTEAGPVLRSNPHYVRQVVANLLDNAAKHGGGWIGLSATYRGNRLVVTVEDDGDGIAPADRERIFERGYRAHPEDGTPAPGKGLGLFVAREFAERLGSRLTVRSERGVGAVFQLRLPLDRSRPSRHQPPSASGRSTG